MKPPSSIPQPTIPSSQLKFDLTRRKEVKEMSPSKGPGAFGLSLAFVVKVDSATHQAALQIFTGEDDVFQRTPVPITYPGAGRRGFVGRVPSPGDLCVVGYLSTKPKEPVILAWLIPGVIAGHDWMPTQDFLATEVDVNPKVRAQFEGLLGRYRHKLRVMNPGNVVFTSDQGSDIVLDEGVFITNRRANEIRLRDQDQALVVRTLQQFHVMGGARISSGMVQRDSTRLNLRMISDGIDWDAAKQVESGVPIPARQELLGASSEPEGFVTPHLVFQRTDQNLPFPDSGLFIQDNTDPYTILNRGLFINSDGYLRDPDKSIPDAEYGGKTIFRVSTEATNSAIGKDLTDSETLTEYRIELQHTWDGTLPVSEQTDGFDSNRIPSNADGASASDASQPFIEFVLGSVVGNDPFTQRGKQLYGFPLVPKIFEGNTPTPRLESGIGVDLNEHASSLFRVRSPLDPQLPESFFSTTKDGRVKIAVGGPQDQNSLEMFLAGNLRVEANGTMDLAGSALNLRFKEGDSIENKAFSVRSDTGAVILSGGGPTTRGSFAARAGDGSVDEQTLPSLLLEAPSGNAHLTSGRITKITGANGIQLTQCNDVTISPTQGISLFAERFVAQCNTLDRTVQGRENTLYSGPKNFLPSNLPVRKTTFAATPLTGHPGGTTDEYKMVFGDRKETFNLGNHTTQIIIGDMTYQTGTGTVKHQAGANSSEMGTASGYSLTVPTGNINVNASFSTTIKSTASVSISSSGTAQLSGTSVTLGGTGNVGGIVSGADLDPLTNFPLSTLGMGSPGHLLGPPIP